MIHVWMTPLDLTAAFVLAVFFFMRWIVEGVGRAALKPHNDHSGSSGRNTEALSHGNARLYTRLNKVHYRDPTVDTDLLCPLAAVLFQRVSSVWILIACRLKDPHRDPVHAGEKNLIAYLLYNFSPVPPYRVISRDLLVPWRPGITR